jgi:ATP-dependent Clp protease ATP-binding subunit ClpC
MKPNLNTARAQEARLAKKIGKSGGQSLAVVAAAAAIIGLARIISTESYHRVDWLVLTLAALFAILSLWYFRRLTQLPANLNSGKLEDRLSADALAILPHKNELNPRLVWQSLVGHWQEIFITNHLLILPETIAPLLPEQAGDMEAIWQKAGEIAARNGAKAIEPGFITAALLLTSPQFEQLLKRMKLRLEDIEELADWLARGLAAMNARKQNTGGIGRDWAFGFTPLLDRFGYNISLNVSGSGSHFSWLAESSSVQAVESAFQNHTGGVVLVGAPGSGKTSHVFALAQKLIAGQTSRALAYHQIVGLNASQIISSATGQGQLEKIMNALLNEAFHAGHIILFFDDAELFLQNGPGSFDATRIMQPLLESRAVPVIMALSPLDWQRLKSVNPAFAGLLTPVILPEPPEADVMRVLEDTAVGFEGRHKIIIAYVALREAYSLSGRYNQDKAYPGSAIDLLEQSVTHAENGKVVTAQSVQEAIESSTGVKVVSVSSAEAGELLNLEDKIHQRMINQSRAVQVVSAALRRNRAGVGAQDRPIGSFLFLGPTGVGKTELAKSLATTYFGSETNMIRLDMSEYQQESDVARLLATGVNETNSLILSVRRQPFSVVLLDEIEKAHPNVLNLLLQLLDEGQLTDASGKPASFRDAIIIATSNAGADTIRQKIEQGQELESFEKDFTDLLISSGQFKPELLNRFDEIVLFRPLKPDELAQIVRLMLAEVNHNLGKQNIAVELTDAAIAKVVEQGNDPRLGARPMRRAVQTMVEDKIANQILAGQINPGDKITLDASDL